VTEYKTVFTVLQSKPPWQPHVIVLLIGVIGTIAALVAVMRYRQRKLIVGIVYAFFLLAAVTVYPGSGIRDMYQRAQDAYRYGQYQTIDGVVTNFHPMPYSGHQNESFVINGIQFTYSDYVLVPCFNNTASHGGPIRDGIRVRIAYSGDCILRLDIADSSR